MNFRFQNKIGDVCIHSHTAGALQSMVAKYGVHVVFNYEDGSSDADSRNIKNAQELIDAYPVSIETAVAFMQGLCEIYDVVVDDNVKVSICYPIPEIGYEDKD